MKGSEPTALWSPPGGTLRLASVSANGRFAVDETVRGNSPGAGILLLDSSGSNAEPVASFRIDDIASQLRLSPDGSRLATIRRQHGSVDFFDTATGTRPVTLENPDSRRFNDLGWLDGGRLVGAVTVKNNRGVYGFEEWLVVWDGETGRILQTATSSRTAMDVLAVAPGGKRFAEAGANKEVRIRDAATLAVEQEFRAHEGPITALAWHSARPLLATALASHVIRLWNLDTGQRLWEVRGPRGRPASMNFSPGGRRLAVSGSDGVTRIWEIE